MTWWITVDKLAGGPWSTGASCSIGEMSCKLEKHRSGGRLKEPERARESSRQETAVQTF
jgi:hypothetical protein